MRLRRFLTRDPMKKCRVAELWPRANVMSDDIVGLTDRHRALLVVRLVAVDLSALALLRSGIVQLAGHRVLIPTMEVRALLPERIV